VSGKKRQEASAIVDLYLGREQTANGILRAPSSN
jgi:hypothetical protein